MAEKEDEMMAKVADIVRKQLDKPKSETFHRKPILIFTKDIATA